MRKQYTEAAERRRIFFPLHILSIFFQTDTVEKLVCLCSFFYIIIIATHLKENNFERSNEYIITLHITTSCAIDNIKTFITVFENRLLAQNFTRYIFI